MTVKVLKEVGSFIKYKSDKFLFDYVNAKSCFDRMALPENVFIANEIDLKMMKYSIDNCLNDLHSLSDGYINLQLLILGELPENYDDTITKLKKIREMDPNRATLMTTKFKDWKFNVINRVRGKSHHLNELENKFSFGSGVGYHLVNFLLEAEISGKKETISFFGELLDMFTRLKNEIINLQNNFKDHD